MTSSKVLVGILIGGAASRMGGRAKGLIDVGNGEVIVARLARVAFEAGASSVLLVGDSASYDALGLARIADAPSGTSRAGPLAGLVALIDAGEGRDVVALACDLPRVAPSILARLIAAPEGTTLAPRHDAIWEPLCARYAGNSRVEARRRLAARELALHALLNALNASALALSDEERATLVDWDTPEDVSR